MRAEQIEMAEFLLDNGIDQNFCTSFVVSMSFKRYLSKFCQNIFMFSFCDVIPQHGIMNIIRTYVKLNVSDLHDMSGHDELFIDN